MPSELIIAVLSLLGTLVGSLAGIMTSNKLSSYRIEQLEKKVEKHNNMIERMVKVESSMKAAWIQIDEMKEEKGNEHYLEGEA